MTQQVTNVYLIENITEYGKLMAYCIEHDISVWRTYWDEREAGKRQYCIDWKEKRCYYADHEYYSVKNSRFWEEGKTYKIVKPIFGVDQWGQIIIEKTEPCD